MTMTVDDVKVYEPRPSREVRISAIQFADEASRNLIMEIVRGDNGIAEWVLGDPEKGDGHPEYIRFATNDEGVRWIMPGDWFIITGRREYELRRDHDFQRIYREYRP